MTFFYQISKRLVLCGELPKTALAFVLAALLGGCRPAPIAPPVLLDFEDLSGWQPEGTPWLTTVRAHSGQHACLADAQSVYTARYTTSYGQLDQPRRLRLGAWVWLPHVRLKAGIVMQVTRDTTVLFYGILPITAVRRCQQWERAQCDFILPPGIEAGDEVSLFIWQTSIIRDDFYVDDITIEKIR